MLIGRFQGNFKSIEPSYFLEAMDMYRQELRYNKLYFSDKIFFFQKGRFHLCVWWCWLGQETATSTGKRDLMDRTATTKYICFCSKNHLLCQCFFCHQVKTGDLFFAEDLLEESDAPFSLPEQVSTTVWSLKNGSQADKTSSSQGRDLAILSSCNHTILSYGTYGFWGGFLAGHGKGIRSESPVDSDCFRSWESFMSFSPVGGKPKGSWIAKWVGTLLNVISENN